MKNDLFLKLPPSAVDVEEMVLGSLLLHQRIVSENIGEIIEDFFYKDNHKIIFKAIQKLYDERKAIDIMTITDSLRKSKQLDIIGGAFAILELTNNVVSSSNISEWINILKSYYLQRSGINIGHKLIDSCYDTDDINNVFVFRS